MKRGILILIILAGFEGNAAQPETPLTLESAVSLALSSDPWLEGSRHREDALNADSVAASVLPAPRISMMASNFPVDSFDINQEAMTQLSVGVSQTFARGESLALASRQKEELAAEEPFLRWNRQAKVKATVTQLWLEAFEAQQSVQLIEENRFLFEQLVDAAQTSYSSVAGRATQQDVVRAELELTQLENRLMTLRQQQDVARQRLSQWIGAQNNAQLPTALPNLKTSAPLEPLYSSSTHLHSFFEYIQFHPLLLALEQRIDAAQTGIALARQRHKPEWGVSAQYGYRAEDASDRSRADLFSVGLTFDVPLFTEHRQDKEVSSSVSRTEATKTEKQLLVRQLVAELDAAIAQLRRVSDRLALYDDRLLPQTADLASAALSAYNNDEGDFAEAARARIAELNARIEVLALAVEQQQITARINYLIAGNPATASEAAQ